jgi:hypothetical protein
MEFFANIAYGELGIAGLFIAYLIWSIQGRDKLIAAGLLREEKWQERCFNTVSDSFQKVGDAVKTVDQVITILERT